MKTVYSTLGSFLLIAACWAMPSSAISATKDAVSQTASPKLVWKFEYGDGDRLVKTTDPAGRATELKYEFDKSGHLVKLVQASPDDSSVVREADTFGRLNRMTDGEGTVAYGYDDAGRLNRVERKGAPAITYTYDFLDRVNSLLVGDFYRIGYQYDYLGRLAAMETPAGQVTYDYQTGLGEVIRSLPNGVKTIWKRQPNGDLEKIIHGFFEKPDAKEYSLLAQYTYLHGPDGRISTIREQSAEGKIERRYGYDPMGRLVKATGPGGKAYGYAYDIVGNRTKATATGHPDQECTYDWAGRLTSVDGKPCKYDACGNLTNISLDGTERQYKYHPDGRLAEAKVGGEFVQYRYDGNGRLVFRKSAAGETRFVPSPISSIWQPLVMDETGGAKTLVIWDGNTPLALVTKGKTEWLLADHLGSVRLVADGKGTVKQQRQYDPFGVPEKADKSDVTFAGFTGLMQDVKGGGIQTLARIYVPEIGQFLQPDPQKRLPSAGANDCTLYVYSGADPVNFMDRDGAERTAAEIQQEMCVQQAETLRSQREMMDRIRQQQSEMRESQGKMRQQQMEMRARQREMLERLRQQSEGVGMRQLQGANLFKNGYLYTYPRTLMAEGLNVYGNLASFVPGIGAAASTALKGGRDILKDQIGNRAPDVHMFLDDQFTHADNFTEMLHNGYNEIQKVRSLVSGSINYTLEAKLHEKTKFKTTYVSADFGKPWSEVNSIIPRIKPSNGIITLTQNVSFKVDVKGGIDYVMGKGIDYGKERLKETLRQYSHPESGGGGMRPSPVGGVYLGGAGGAISGLGVLKGIRMDANGNLVLVGDTTGEIKLPPLRLDDVVTVFRSVYLDGEGPTVTIDPAPENPEKSAMIIKHSKATDGTYVGWVLYQADRLMKGYMLGVDNKTQKDILSVVPGYREVVDSIYFGTEDPRKSQKAGNWERFWIVPAETNRFEGTRRELTLFDVPLKVKTQKMKWVKDKLEDDLTGKSSSGAVAFTGWFTKNYDGITAEQYLLPPAATGITAPVPVFTELRQIALMTAIAEKLRDQGVPMPFWMWDYEVQKVPFETTTPALEVTRKQVNGDVVRTSRIFGGVEMSPESKAVKTYATAAEVAKAPPEVRAEVDRSVKLAGRLEESVAAALPPVGAVPLVVRKVEDEKHAYQAVSLPGATSQALGPCRLQEVDLVVSFAGGREIRLARHFNSFFNPKGPWDKGWTMDLPRLQKIRIPGSREGSRVTYTTGYELLTPLNSSYARFKEIRPVQELGGSKLQVPDAECPFYGLANTKLDCLKDSKTKQAIKTVVLCLKDGGEWYFSPEGDFIAAKEGPQMTIYERGTDGQVSRIVGMLEDAIYASIDLEYRKGILVKAAGVSLEDLKAKAAEVSYAYDPSGRLEGVGFEDGKTGYSYQDSWVSSVSWTDKKEGAAPEILNAFEYNERGQVVSEQRGEQTTRHEIAAVPGGIETSVARTAKGTARIFARYDTQMRPVEDQTADGTHTAWNYQPDGSVETTMTMPDKRKVTIVDRKLSEAKSDKRRTAATDGADRWQQTVMILDRKLPDTKSDKRKTAATEDVACWQRTVMTKGGPTMESRFDAGGNLTRFTENQRVLLTQQWRKDGQLSKAATEDQEVSCQYGEHGLLSAVSVRPPKADAKPSEWQNTKVDRRGAPTAIEDGTGLDLQFGYDASGALASAVQKTPDGFLGFNVERDPDGRVRIVKSSWGDTSYNYAKDGGLTRVESTRGGRSATVELNDGLVRKATGVDGGVTTFDYNDKGNLAGAPRGVQCANGLKLAHEYTADERLKAVAVGTTRRVRLGYDAKGRVNEYAWEPLAGGSQ